MRNALTVLAALAVLLGSCMVCGSGEPEKKKDGEEKKADAWMKAKQKATQEVLAGLTEGDFDKIRTNAQAMNFLGYLEKWAKPDTPGYKEQVSYFDFANRELIRQAKAKNIEGATLAYTQLTISCVQCHKIVRDAKTK